MNYKKHYDLLISTRKDMNRKREKTCIYHNHHIVPKSLGGDNSKSNLVLLTPKEHFVAHLLLLMISKHENDYESYRKMAYAFWNMCGRNKLKTKNSRAYKFAVETKKSLSVWVKKEQQQKFIPTCDLKKFIIDGWIQGRLPHSEETVESIRNSKSGLIWVTRNGVQKPIEKERLEEHVLESWEAGRTVFTESHKINIKNGLTGRDLSDSHKKNIGLSLKGRENKPLSNAHKKRLGKPIVIYGIKYDGLAWAAKELNTTKLDIFYKLRNKELIDCYYL